MKGRGGRKAFKEDSGEKKAKIPSPWISNCLSRDVSVCTLGGFREENPGRGWGLQAGGRGQRAEGRGPGAREPPT